MQTLKLNQQESLCQEHTFMSHLGSGTFYHMQRDFVSKLGTAQRAQQLFYWGIACNRWPRPTQLQTKYVPLAG